MKRTSNLFDKICSPENLILAESRARKGKTDQYGVRLFDQNAENNLLYLHYDLVHEQFRTSEYSTFKIFEPKEREVYRLPYYPDRIVHHAIMNVLEPIFVKLFVKETYSCIKGRGIHAAATDLKISLRDKPGTKYCLKLDIKKFYPNIDHEILKSLLRRKIKDDRLMRLLDGIIDSAPGLPIGNYLSQYFANYYLSYFDRWVKSELRVKHYFRYLDDIVILSPNKQDLHKILAAIRHYLQSELKLEIKGTYQVFPVSARGIDFLGYKFYHTHTLLRSSIKKRFARAMAKNPKRATIASYYGWAKHANTTHLLKKLFHEKILRNGNFPRNIKLHWFENEHQPNTQPRNNDTGVFNQTKQVQRQRGLFAPTDQIQGRTESAFHRIKGSHQADPAGRKIRFPFHDNNYQR